MSIVFEVIDLSCQSLDDSFFTPNIKLSTKATTHYATLYGYSEFGTPSTPPKKYRKITVSGFSKRVGFTAEQVPRQCAGGKYIWSGVGEVDMKGNVISTYRKDFFAECPKQFWPEEGILSLPGEVQTSPILAKFVAFCWSGMAESCPSCNHDESTWAFLGNQAINSPVIDFSGFYALAGDVVTTPTSTSINVVHNEITNILTGQPYDWVLFGTSLDNYPINVGSRTYDGRALVTNPPNLVFPAVGASDDGVNFHIAQYIVFTDTSNHSMVLSEEYTDADALANATVVTSTGATAQNLPRTTGFTSVTTGVVYTLTCGNLMKDRNYLVTVDLWEQGPSVNTHTTKSYPFTADDTTHTIIDAIPTPVAGHTITVSKPAVNFAP